MKFKQVILSGLLCAISTWSCAQWVWIDNSGRKVYSDSAPPPEIPEKSILRQPSNRNNTPLQIINPAASAVPAASTPVSAASRPSGKSKELEDKRKQAEQAEADKRKVEEEKQKAVMAENCRRAKQTKAALDAGQRVTRFSDKGEREFLDDAQRTAELRRMEEVIRTQCQ